MERSSPRVLLSLGFRYGKDDSYVDYIFREYQLKEYLSLRSLLLESRLQPVSSLYQSGYVRKAYVGKAEIPTVCGGASELIDSD